MHETKKKKVAAGAAIEVDRTGASEWTGSEVPLPSGSKEELAISRFQDGLDQFPKALKQIGIESSGTELTDAISERLSRLDGAPEEYVQAAAPLVDCLEKLRGIVTDFGGRKESSFDRIELSERLQWLEQEISLFLSTRNSGSTAATNHLEGSCAEFRDQFAEDEAKRPRSWIKRWDPKGVIIENCKSNSLMRELGAEIESLRERGKLGREIEEEALSGKGCFAAVAADNHLRRTTGRSRFGRGRYDYLDNPDPELDALYRKLAADLGVPERPVKPAPPKTKPTAEDFPMGRHMFQTGWALFGRFCQYHFRLDRLEFGPWVAGPGTDCIISGPIYKTEGQDRELLALLDRLTFVRPDRHIHDFWEQADRLLKDIDYLYDEAVSRWLPESVGQTRTDNNLIRICEYNYNRVFVEGYLEEEMEAIEKKLLILLSKKEPQEGFGRALSQDELSNLLWRRGARQFTLVKGGEITGFDLIHTEPDSFPEEAKEVFAKLDQAGLIKRSKVGWNEILGISFEGRKACRRAGLSAYDILHQAKIETARGLGLDQLFGVVREGVQANTAKRRHLDVGWQETGITIHHGSVPYQIMKYDVFEE